MMTSNDAVNLQINYRVKLMMEALKKVEWPGCAEQSIQHIHTQCQKFSKDGVPSPEQLNRLMLIISLRSIRHLIDQVDRDH